MIEKIPISVSSGVNLVPKTTGISTVHITDEQRKNELSWDRYVRLKASAKAVVQTGCTTLLDAGGYDGALGFFIPDMSLDLIDPATTGGSVLAIPCEAQSYDTVVAVDVLEHIEPSDRARAIAEIARVAKSYVILNYPCSDSNEAQKLAYKLTKNSLLKEHVDYGLPDSKWVLSELRRCGFEGVVEAHTSIAIWLGQYISMNLAPESASELNRHLIENYAQEPFSKPLYHLLVCKRVNIDTEG